MDPVTNGIWPRNEAEREAGDGSLRLLHGCCEWGEWLLIVSLSSLHSP